MDTEPGKIITGRINILCGLLLLLVVPALVFKAVWVVFVDGAEWKSKAPANYLETVVELKPNRGDICASDGRILATSVPYYELRFDPVAVNSEVFKREVDSLAYCLSAFFKDHNKQYYRDKLTRARSHKHPNRYLRINRRKVDYKDLMKIRKFPIFRLGRNRGGFQEIMYDRRIQPHLNLAGRTIGYMNENKTGNREGHVGLEAAFENELKGIPGKGMKQMMSGKLVTIKEREPVDGNDVVTTLNVDYQDIVQNALRKQLVKSDASCGTAILMEVATGDIKAIANMSRLESGVYGERENMAINGAGEPGSVIKAASFIALMEDGIVTPDDTVNLGSEGKYKFHDRVLSEAHGGLGKVTVRQMMEKSANGIAKLVNDHYKNCPEKFISRWYAMGLDKKTGICLPGEANPYISYVTDKEWSGTSLPWLAFGYGSKLTPLQILAFYNAIANNGQRVKPRLVKEIRRRGEVVEKIDVEEEGSRICSRTTLDYIHDMLESVVKNGTARNIFTPNYRIAGKTGTARIGGKGGYVSGSYRASFVGYFPADKPLFSCIVVIDNPRNGYYATTVAAPVFREISDKVYAMAYLEYGEPAYEKQHTLPVCKNGYKDDFEVVLDELEVGMQASGGVESTDWVLTRSDKGKDILLQPRRVNYATVPNVKGMGLRDALFVLENTGLHVGVSGAGMVCSQSLPAGSEVPRGSYIQIILR